VVRASNEVRVVLAAGGLGTRVHHWARYLPKEFYPVGGRPGIAWILEEIAGLGAGHVVIVYHPYYRAFAEWAGQALSHAGETRYRRAARRPTADYWTGRGPVISFVAQHGRSWSDSSSWNSRSASLAFPHSPVVEAIFSRVIRV
jgi:hypothetical protein